MRRYTCIVFVAWWLWILNRGAAEPLVTVVDQGPTGVIVVPAALAAHPYPGKPDASETLNAALELSQYLEKITGRFLPVIAEGRGVYQFRNSVWKFVPLSSLNALPAGRPEIHVGWTVRALNEVDKDKVEKLDIDGFLIKITPESIFLVGPRDWSTAYAVYTFLDDLCGVRWFIPGELGEDVPRASRLAVPIMEKTFEPAYQHRQYSGFQFYDAVLCHRWAMHQKVRARLQYHHNLWAVFDVKKYGEKYPDLYPIIGGHRRKPGVGNTSGWQPCLTHPKAVEFAMDYAREVFSKNPNASSISLGINDGGGYCECPNCMRLVNNDLPKPQRRAAWFFQFANRVAEGFDKEFPDKQIGYLLYGECHLAPGLKLHPRLIGFEVFPSFRLVLPEEKKIYDERLEELSKTCPTFGLYDWFYGDGLCIPRLQIRQAKYWLEQGYKMGARHIKAEAYMNWGLDGFKYWMHSKLMWNPSLDVDQMMNDFLVRFFKESAQPMREYFKVVERYTVTPLTTPGKEGKDILLNFHFRYPDQLETFPPKAVEECEPLFDQAEKLARSEIVRQRIQYFRTAFTVAKMLTLRHHLVKEALPLLQKPESLPQGISLLARALSKDLDVEQYYKWVLRGDPFCVRYPEESMFNSALSAVRAAGATITRQIMSVIQKSGNAQITPTMLTETTNQILDRVWADIRDPDARAIAKLVVGPVAGKVMLCNKAPTPHLDGKLDDECWRTAAVYSDFSRLSTGKPAEFLTEVRTAHDGVRLYVALKCHQDTNPLLAWTKGRDDRVWREDGIELLINKITDTTPEERCQIIVNTQGNIWDYFNGHSQWNGDIRTGIAIAPDYYTMEIAIPLADIGISPAKDRIIRFNCARNVYARQTLGTGEAKEISAWYPSDDNVSPESRGWLIFNN